MQRRPGDVDGVYDAPGDRYDDRPTGLLTRFVPHSLRTGKFYRLFLRLTRVLQFLSSVISLGLFSRRLAKVNGLVNRIKTRRGVNSSFGAVEGILAAATLYTLITMLLTLLKRSANPGGRMLRWTWVLLDLLFVGAFIAVAVLTRKNGGNAGPGRCYSNSSRMSIFLGSDPTGDSNDDNCNLPWGTFVLAIISTILHAITAAFHELKEHRRNRAHLEEEKAMHHGTATTGTTGHTATTGHTGTAAPVGTTGRY